MHDLGKERGGLQSFLAGQVLSNLLCQGLVRMAEATKQLRPGRPLQPLEQKLELARVQVGL